MNPLDKLHDGLIFGRRVKCLSNAIAPRLPANASVLDVGCGDGSISRAVLDARPDVEITGVDVLVRRETRIPVKEYDGRRLPCDDKSFDAITIIDVVHHTDEPDLILAEAARVSRGIVIIKDHLNDGFLAESTLRFMDRVGNDRHGVRLPYNYLSEREWRDRCAHNGLEITEWETDLDLYPPIVSAVFGRRLHVLMTLQPPHAR